MFLSLHHHTQCLDEAVHAEPETVSCDNGCFAADLQMDMLQDLNWMIHKKNPLHGFFFNRPVWDVMNYEIGRNPYFPKFHGYKAMKHLTGRLESLLGDGTGGMTGLFPGWQKGGEAIVFYLF